MIYTTLNKIRARGPCPDGWEKLLAHLGKTSADDEPLALLTILDANGFDDAVWCCRTLPEHNKEWRLYAVWCARRAQHLMTDDRSLRALDVAERYALGQATDTELESARADAARAADAGRAADADAVRASWVAADAAWAAATKAEVAGAGLAWAVRASRVAASSARAIAGATAGAAARNAAWIAERKAQEAKFRRVITETES